MTRVGGYIGIVLDMRDVNGKTEDSAFDPFFMEMGLKLEFYKIVHSRRRSGNFPWSPNATNMSMTTFIYKLVIVFARVDANICSIPFAVSTRSMVDKIRNVLEDKHAPATLKSVGIKILSHSYVAMQFAPKDKYTSKALSFTCDCVPIVVVCPSCFLLIYLLGYVIASGIDVFVVVVVAIFLDYVVVDTRDVVCAHNTIVPHVASTGLLLVLVLMVLPMILQLVCMLPIFVHRNPAFSDLYRTLPYH